MRLPSISCSVPVLLAGEHFLTPRGTRRDNGDAGRLTVARQNAPKLRPAALAKDLSLDSVKEWRFGQEELEIVTNPCESNLGTSFFSLASSSTSVFVGSLNDAPAASRRRSTEWTHGNGYCFHLSAWGASYCRSSICSLLGSLLQTIAFRFWRYGAAPLFWGSRCGSFGDPMPIWAKTGRGRWSYATDISWSSMAFIV